MAGNQLTYNLVVDSREAASSINEFFSTIEDGAAKAKSKLNQALGQGIKTSVEIEFRNGELVAKTVQNINQESNRLQKTYNAVNGELGKTPAQLRQQLNILKQLRDNTAKFGRNSKDVNSDWAKLTDRIKAAQRALDLMTKGDPIQRLGASLSGLAGKFALVQTLSNGVSKAISAAFSGFTGFLDLGQELQVLGLQLEAFTGSVEAADNAFRTFREVAASTRFNVEEVAKAGQILLAYGVDTETAIDATKNLAIAASATGGDISLLSRNLGQAASQGRAYTRDLIQFAIQGIPIWDELAVVTGKSTSELKELAKEGKIGFDEVNQAIKNMTGEGSAFLDIANRMDQTFTGQLAKMESGVQTLAKAVTETASAVDQAFGAPVVKLFDAITNSLIFLADNWKTITTLVVAATTATAAYLAVSNFGAIISAIRTVVNLQNLLKISTAAAAIAQATLQALLGNWVAIGAALAAGTAVAVGLNAALESQAQEAALAAGSVDEVTKAVEELSEQESRAADLAGASARLAKKAYLEALNQADEAKKKLDQQIEASKELKKEITERYKSEIKASKEKEQAIKDSISEEKNALSDLKEQIKSRYESERDQLQENLELVRQRYDEEIAALEAKTPAEERLQAYRKKEIEQKLRSTKLTEKERLELEAQLERMNNNAKIQELRNKKKEEEKKITEQLAEKEKAYKKEIENAEKASTRRVEALKEELKAAEAETQAFERGLKDAIAEIDNAIEKTRDQQVELEKIPDLVQQQVRALGEAAQAYDVAKRKAQELRQALKEATDQARALAQQRANAGAATTTAVGRASGGPVTGGSTYTVNELGKEAFLSASGRLSMINAPSWGQWRAPGSGTVIPAHLTQQLNIPSGGVSLNSAASMNTGRADAGNGMRGMMKALAGLAGGGNVNNNVTIQAANTTKAASDILVELTKVRHRRYR